MHEKCPITIQQPSVTLSWAAATSPIVTGARYSDFFFLLLLLLQPPRAIQVLQTEEDNPKFIHSEAKNLLLLLLALLAWLATPTGRPGNRHGGWE